jgi:hypothetical protein
MPTERELDNLDSLIDAALPGYAAAEPRPGIERRVLANALAQQPRRNSFVLAWALAIPAVVCALALLRITQLPAPAPRITAPTSAAIPLPSPGSEAARHIPREIQRHAHHPHSATPSEVAAVGQLPKQEVFPTPTPLTPEEERMLALTNSPVRPSAQSDVVAEIPALHIAELNIKPLQIPESGTETPLDNQTQQK